MQLNEFTIWKDGASAYWTSAITAGPNAFYTYAINEPSVSAQAGPPGFGNSSALFTSLASALNITQGYYDSYVGNTTLEGKVKDSLIGLYSYITMKYVNVADNAPEVVTIDIDAANWFTMLEYTLPDYSTLFTLTPQEVVGYNGNPITTNADLITYKMWYAGEVLASPEPTATYITDQATLVSTGITAVNNTINTAAASDIAVIDSFTTSSGNASKDNIIYRLFEKPSVVVYPIDIRQKLLIDYNYETLLNSFGWEFRGFNAP